jgi:hypothetical protein
MHSLRFLFVATFFVASVAGSFCPNGDEVNCYAQPCDVTQCNEPYVTCVDNYCGGCHAVFTDAAGNQVCDGSSSVERKVTSASACTSDDECGDSQFCSAGACRTFGSCGSLLDCLNPSNIYLTVKCFGYLKCNFQQCGLVCGLSSCPNNDQIECDAPCAAVTKCDEPYEHCVDDYCGRCSAILINAAGEEVCPDEPSQDDPGSCDFSCDGNIFRRIICILARFFWSNLICPLL